MEKSLCLLLNVVFLFYSILFVPNARSHSWGTDTMRKKDWLIVKLTTTR